MSSKESVMSEDIQYKTFKTKKEVQAFVKEAVSQMEQPDELYCVGIEAKGERGNLYASASFENTAEEPVMQQFIETYGPQMEIRLLEWGEGSKRGKAELRKRRQQEKAQGQPGGGRRSPLSGSKIYPRDPKDGEELEHVIANPRREGTHGWNSWEVLRKHWEATGGEPMLYEDFQKAGGRPNDLRWDLDRDHLKVVKSEAGDDAGSDADAGGDANAESETA